MNKVVTIDREPGAFVRDTRHLSVEDRGAYQEICDQIVILGQDEDPPSLPDDDRAIANMLGWSVAKWRKTKHRLCTGPLAVLMIANGRLTQPRVAAEVLEAKDRIRKSSNAGVQSGIARAKRKVVEQMLNDRSNTRSTSVATRDELGPQLNANSGRTQSEPLTINQEPVTNLKKETPTNAREEGSSKAPMTEAQFLYHCDRIAKWRVANPDIGPGEEDFDAKFEDKFGFTWEHWHSIKERFASPEEIRGIDRRRSDFESSRENCEAYLRNFGQPKTLQSIQQFRATTGVSWEYWTSLQREFGSERKSA